MRTRKNTACSTASWRPTACWSIADEQKIAVLAYSPLANGLLTGKMPADRQFGPGDLRKGNRRFTPANIEQVNAMLEQLRPLAERHGATVSQLVIAWTAAQPGLTCALCGARSATGDGKRRRRTVVLSPDELETIGKLVHA